MKKLTDIRPDDTLYLIKWELDMDSNIKLKYLLCICINSVTLNREELVFTYGIPSLNIQSSQNLGKYYKLAKIKDKNFVLETDDSGTTNLEFLTTDIHTWKEDLQKSFQEFTTSLKENFELLIKQVNSNLSQILSEEDILTGYINKIGKQ